MANHDRMRMINRRQHTQECMGRMFAVWINGETSDEALLGFLGAYVRLVGEDAFSRLIATSVTEARLYDSTPEARLGA
jgi:hypothetical protein